MRSIPCGVLQSRECIALHSNGCGQECCNHAILLNCTKMHTYTYTVVHTVCWIVILLPILDTYFDFKRSSARDTMVICTKNALLPCARMCSRVMRLVASACICIYMSTKNRLFSALLLENLLNIIYCLLF